MGKPNTTTAIDLPDFQALYDLGLSICIVPRGEKRPAMQWANFQTARAPESLVKDWQGANANVAIITGALSNLFVIDVDSDEAQALLDEIGMPKTPTVRTSRGRHYYFRNPPYEVRNKVHIRGIALDVRGEGGLVIGPGSMHASGAIYEWEVPPTECDFAELPTAFLNLLDEESRSSSLAKQPDCASYIEAEKFSFWFNRQVTEGVTSLREAKEGKRNDTLFRVAVELANHTAALALDWEGVAAILSPEALAINVKYRPQREVPNYANFVFLSNLEAPIFIEQADRRFFVIDSPAQPKKDAEYWTNFYAWWKANMGVVKAYFESIYVGDFEPKAHPPMTPAKERLMKQSETPLVQNLRELLDEMNYPLREVCTIDDIRKALRTKGMKSDSPQRLSKALQSLGCQPLGQSRLTNGKASLWALQRADYWQTTSHRLRREEYEGVTGDLPFVGEAA